MRSLKSNNRGQLLLIAGVVMASSLIIMTAVNASLYNTITIQEKESYVLSEYREIREKFGLALQDSLEQMFQNITKDDYHGNNDLYIDFVETSFDLINDKFYFFEMKHGLFFSASYGTSIQDRIVYKNNQADGLIVTLLLKSDAEYITEDVTYYI